MARRIRDILGDVAMGAANGYAAGAQSGIPEAGLAQGFLGGINSSRQNQEYRQKQEEQSRREEGLKMVYMDPEFRKLSVPEKAYFLRNPDEYLSKKQELVTKTALLEKALQGKERIAQGISQSNQMAAQTKAARGKPLPGGEADKFAQIGTLKDILQDVKANYNPEFVGPVQSRVGRAGQTFGFGATPERARFYQNIASIRNQILNLRSGAAISAQEAARLIQELPQETRSDVDFEASMGNFEKTLDTILRNKRDVFRSTGYNVDEIGGTQGQKEEDFSDIGQYLE